MSIFELSGIIIGLIALLGYLNHTTFKLPDTIGITLSGLILSALAIGAGYFAPMVTVYAKKLTMSIDFYELVFHGLLGLLLFAGSLHVKVSELSSEKYAIGMLSFVTVIVSSVLIGLATYLLTYVMGFKIELIDCMLFGALISPTDPVAVLGILKRVGLPKTLDLRIKGESLFNDAAAVMVFLTLLNFKHSAISVNLISFNLIKSLFFDIVGAVAIAFVFGLLAVLLLKKVNSYAIEIMITLSIPTLGYSIAESLHVSAPLAVVIMGLIIGNYAIKNVVSIGSRQQLLNFWELVDDLLNLVLFSLIGILLITLPLSFKVLVSGLILVLLILGARLISVYLPLKLIDFKFSIKDASILTWAGVRGGVSIAMSLALDANSDKPYLISLTYIVVLFSLLVQALTLERLVAKLTNTKKA